MMEKSLFKFAGNLGDVDPFHKPSAFTDDNETLEGGAKEIVNPVAAGAEPKELFHRSPRVQERLPQGKIEIPLPPQRPSKPEINWLSTLLPAGVTVIIAVVIAAISLSPMMMLYTLPMTAAGLVVSIVNYKRGNKKYEKNLIETENAYLRRLNEVKARIGRAQESQMKAMLLADPAPEKCLEAVNGRSTSLWCREPGNADFVSVRIGTGRVRLSTTLEYRKNETLDAEKDLKQAADEAFNAGISIENAPICCDIRGRGIVGVLGEEDSVRRELQNMIFHLSANHCYTDLRLVCVCDEKDRAELAWLNDLPHTHGASDEESLITYTQEEANELFKSLCEMFKERKKEAGEESSYGTEKQFLPYMLFILFEPKYLKKSDPINQYLFMEQGLGIGCVMAAQKMQQLPKQCTEIITIADGEGEIYNTASATERRYFIADKISPELTREFGQAMRPLYCDENIDVNALPMSYTLYQMLGVSSMSEYDIGRVWASSDILSSKLAPSAPFGVLENENKVFFNSPPTGDNGGAHALIAGATGSGKSEFLLSLIVSLALRYPPDEVGFLVIDFKGDSIAGKLTDLPHLRGIITSLDGDELRRSLISINAENKKRQRIFKEYNDSHPYDGKKINDIRDYMEKYRRGEAKEPLPHLFIVVDEFAEMKRQLPDIMDQFLSTAQVGRSLGVHLVLATQSPSGVVDGKIQANILKRMCLKAANASESREMIGSALASRIKNPGRGYLKVDEDLQLFQSAYGGGKIRVWGGESTEIYEAISAMATYCRRKGIKKLPDIFRAPLPASAAYPGRQTRPRQFGALPIGLRDDPETQFQGEYCMNVFSRNTLIAGSQGMGKSNLLQAIIRGAATAYTPEDVNIYIMDFSSFFLKNFEPLPHVGGAVTLPETERITNLFRLLNKEMRTRQEKFMRVGVSSYSAYRESGARDLPQILLIVDDLAAAKAYFQSDDDPLLAVCKEGLSLGISVVATSMQPVGGISYLPTFANRIAFYNNDSTVYSTLLGHTKLRPKEIPGRCLVPLENDTYECQSFLAFDSEREIDRADEIRALCREAADSCAGKHARAIPSVPQTLSVDDALRDYPEAFENGGLMLGIDYETVAPVSQKLSSLGIMAISGQESAVKSFQRYMLTAANADTEHSTEYYIVDGIDHTLQPFSNTPCVTEYAFLPEQAPQILKEVYERAEERYARVAGGDTAALDNSPTLVLMLNSAEVINAISADKTAMGYWNAITGKLKSMKVCVVFGALENAAIPYSAEVLKKFKDNRKIVFLDRIESLKIGDLPYSGIKKFSGATKKDDGYLVFANSIARVKIPSCPLPGR